MLNRYLVYIKAYTIKFVNFFLNKKKLSIGSGIRNWFGWEMYDSLDYPLITKVNFSPKTKLPKKKFNFIFISHFIEHICDETFYNLLKELKKISTKETKILIKYPDYEYFYKNFFEKKNKSKFMKITNNNFSHYLPLWKNYNVEDNVENRVSMMFCDYSNIYFKDQYTLNFLENINDKAYHGPAIISKKKLNKIFNEKKFKKIQNSLKQEILKDKKFYKFNHTNIWNIKDLINILKGKHFKIVSTNKNFIYKKLKNYIYKDEFYFLGHWSRFIYIKT
jgi:hypothetical protein